MKRCPHCEQDLSDAAITCRHCDEFLVPAGPTRCDVVLLYPGCRGLDIISAVSVLTGQSAAASRRLVLACRDAPQRILSGISLDDAGMAWFRLKRTGATAEIIESTEGRRAVG